MQIVAADGTPPYAFSLVSGDLPEGITLSGGGLLSGMLKQFGQFSFTVRATDSESETAQKTFQLTIQPPPLVILTSTLPYGSQNQPYSLQIAVDGDAPPYVFSQTGGTLPNGINLSPSGLLSGTPTEFGSFNFEVTVTDFFDTTAQRSFFLTVFPELRIPTNPNLPTGITDQFYSRQISADGGIAPYVFSLAGGALPNGFSLSSSGVVSGTASQPGAFSFVVEVADAQGIQVQKTFNLTISELYVVTTAADTNDGVCDAQCSLREAVAVGDSIPGSSNVIEFSAFFDNPARLQLNSPIIVNKTTEIRGKGRNKTLISSANPNVGPKFRILGTGDTVFRDLRMDEGNFFVFTRSIENQSSGRLTIANSIFQGSAVTNVDGGAILQTAGTLVVDNSTFRDNFIASLNSDCAGRGAAIAILGGTAKITNSTFSRNSSPSGSAIYANGAITIENSTISYNIPSSAICGLSSNATILNESGSMTITNSTVFENLNNGVSGSALSGNIAIKNSIIARNSRYQGGSITSPNIGVGVVSLGHNLIEFAPALAAGLPNANNDYVGTAAVPLNPLLNALALNGGETETHMPQGASLSINNGASAGAPPTDQRGVARPQGAGIDIGAFETDVPVTSAESPAGADVNTALGTVSVTFSNVTDAGTTTQIPIYPAISGTLPGGFSFGAGYPAFQITTTANYSGAILVCIQIPNVSTQAFNNLRLFHNENGALVDRTFSRNNVTRTICAQTTSLSPFVIAESLAPTAAGVSISGRILAEKGAVARARVLLTEANGTVRTAVSNSFGYYRFEGIEAGQIVTLEVRSKLYQFEPRVVAASDNLSDVDFTALEITSFGKLPDD
jgi:CSLREA domain-containing protein